MLVSSLANSSTLNMEATSSSEMSVDFHWPAQRYIPEDRPLYNLTMQSLLNTSCTTQN
jgi:hypothetical protein